MWTAEGDATGLEGDGPCRADVNTPAAVDTLMIAHTADIHGALRRTAAAAGALGSLHLDANHGDFGEQAIKSAPRGQRKRQKAR